ncbi:NO-inducible flavohemoprotein [Tenacibaculum sp. M341]|uniref:NO-inducible flavohemoprotein n=1 Tax=Tenacibaculum sp. M341 TaxID=2530339 RepID=UPI00104DE0FF|nr:NO-inducible flavohemoprotein [Tenacibaculum sp. M341]TCI90630.1 NO-inducible flavohemoprotein [Tenacibaculum sp. M341]
MASKKTIEIVKATAPVLKLHGEAITKVFYQLLFEKHPELKDVFNMVNQQKGTQQKALANAVFKYAVYIEKLEMMKGELENIAQKHVSLSIPKEAYPIVGENLLLAIKKVLGDAATPEIMEAWEEAYNDLAVLLTDREEELYETKEKSSGGFRGMEDFVVAKKVKENSNITSFYLKRKDGTPVPHFIPGQYVAVMVDIPESEHKHTRNYSLSDTNTKDYLRLSIKKEIGNPNGIVSNYMHAKMNVNSILKVGMPSGNFVLKNTEKPIVLISGGIGITPLLSMLKGLPKKPTNITFIQCVLNSEHQVFDIELNNQFNDASQFVKVFSAPLVTDVIGENYDYKGFFNSQILKDLQISNNSDFYFCGPTPFMSCVLKELEEFNVKNENINYEFFGPAEELMN